MIAAFFYWSGVVAWIGVVVVLVPLTVYVEIELRRPVPKSPRWGADDRPSTRRGTSDLAKRAEAASKASPLLAPAQAAEFTDYSR